MAAPNAPMPLSAQYRAGQTITITVPLQGLGAAPTFVIGGSTFNNGNPTATFSIVTSSTNANQDVYELLDFIDGMWREGAATVA